MRVLCLILVSSLAAFAQLTDGVATSVTRTVTLTADQADFSVIAAANLGTTQQQVIQALTEAGISNLTPANTALTQLYDYSKQPPDTKTLIVYQFTFSVPATGMAATAKTLEAVRAKPPETLQIFQYAASLNASPATVDAMRQMLLPQLFAEAQKKAQTLASATGLKLGAVKGVAESSYSTGNSLANYISSTINGSINATYSSSNSAAGTQYTFYVNLTFGLTQ